MRESLLGRAAAGTALEMPGQQRRVTAAAVPWRETFDGPGNGFGLGQALQFLDAQIPPVREIVPGLQAFSAENEG